mmetsp:Transcript_26873/g.46696  ORF Transcript_26873/g.46696 Transcript_26873/m.46696 type:complete len:116 (-) Transcript_26873:37-384(-)
MDLREAAATSGVPRNTILVLSSIEPSEEEEYRWVNDLAWWKRRGSTAIEDVDAWCRLYLADADGPIRRPRVPNWKPKHGRRTHAAIVKVIATTSAAECLMVAELIMEAGWGVGER